MCVIAFSPKGVDAPTEEKIRQMFRANPDGAGFAYEQGNKVKYKKGFMNVEDLIKELQPLKQWKNKNMAIHFRIGTAGENDEHTCHPFKISSNYGDLRKTEGEGPVLFHNGILANGGIVDENSSDTQDFVVAFAPLLEKYNKSKVRDQWFEKIIAGNRMLIMYGKNKIKMYGEWKKDGDLFVSNLTYKSYAYGYGTYCPYGYHYGYIDEDEGEDEYKEDIAGEWERYWAKREEQKKRDKQLAEKLFAELKKNQYIYVSDYEMDTLLEHADEYSYNIVQIKGIKYGYSYEAGCVWSEEAMY